MKELAQYVAPKRKAVEVSGPKGSPVPLAASVMTPEEFEEAMASAVKRPCLNAWLFPFGALCEAPPCTRQRPFVIAGDRHGVTGPRPGSATRAQVHRQSALQGIVPLISRDPHPRCPHDAAAATLRN
jgi:hypothetical protein